MKAPLRADQICEVANRLFLQRGFDQVNMADIAEEASIDEASLYTLFGNKQDIILFLYQSINADWLLQVNAMSTARLADRFEDAMAAKIKLLEPYSPLLTHLMGHLLQNPKIGVQSPRTSHIRAMGMQAMETIIGGATDSRRLKKGKDLAGLLYTAHWGILFLSIHTGDTEKTLGAVRIAARLLQQAGSKSRLLGMFPFFKDIGDYVGSLVPEAEKSASPDREILKIIFNHRKISVAEPGCLNNTCETCMHLHEPQIRYFTRQAAPVHFILPAFPAKSPNRTKVLGTLPDLGEEIALKTLEDLCSEIRAVYEPGAHITICSDGRIFSELVGVTDEDVSRYVEGIREIIRRLQLNNVSIVNLEDLLDGNSFDELRSKILDTYAEPLESLREKQKSNTDFKHLFNGIHRFITEDRRAMFPELSASRVKTEASSIAMKVIQHSNAWTRFLSYVFPEAVRLSIHPYPAHSDKIGIQLTRASDNWLTPWHGVIVLQNDGYVLMKKSEAEEKAARLVYRDGQPHYYTLIPE